MIMVSQYEPRAGIAIKSGRNEIKNLWAARTPIDEIAKKHDDGLRATSALNGGDMAEERLKKIGASVNVADCVNIGQ